MRFHAILCAAVAANSAFVAADNFDWAKVAQDVAAAVKESGDQAAEAITAGAEHAKEVIDELEKQIETARGPLTDAIKQAVGEASAALKDAAPKVFHTPINSHIYILRCPSRLLPSRFSSVCDLSLSMMYLLPNSKLPRPTNCAQVGGKVKEGAEVVHEAMVEVAEAIKEALNQAADHEDGANKQLPPGVVGVSLDAKLSPEEQMKCMCTCTYAAGLLFNC